MQGGVPEQLASRLLTQGHPLRIRARGSSMLPFVRDGDLALVTPARGQAIVVGDIVCYETSPGRLFLHRIIKRDGQRLIAKGDALTFTDVLDPGRLLGTLVAIERHGRVTRLDTRAARWRNRVIASVAFVLPRILPAALRARRIWRGGRRG